MIIRRQLYGEFNNQVLHDTLRHRDKGKEGYDERFLGLTKPAKIIVANRKK